MTSVEVKKVLNTLLRDPENNKCGDCKASTHPRWASWSLGVFLCIKCAGFHRSMGTHISKVKSVDLDTWKEEHLEAVLRYGNNKKFNEHYENKLGGGTYVPDQSKIGQFIKTKYELKRWVGDGPIDAGQPGEVHAGKSTRVQAAQPAQPAQPAVPAVLKQASSQLELNLTPVATGGSSQGSAGSAGSANLPQRTNVYRPSERPDLKKSILSLYANPRASQSQTASPSAHSLANAAASGAANPWAGTQAAETDSQSSLSLDDDLFKNVWS